MVGYPVQEVRDLAQIGGACVVSAGRESPLRGSLAELTEHFPVEVLADDGRVFGRKVSDERGGEVFEVVQSNIDRG
ncbi:hypothetical protein [Brachybacterium sacelli]|uniref:hypothetical protein n=1 Tax=Brachybacterium sacelli TaxID=173364 RepID=UPI0036122727